MLTFTEKIAMNSRILVLPFRLMLLVALAATTLFTTACKKDAPEVPDYSATDREIIKQYLSAHAITTAQAQPSGLYFLPVRTNPTGTPIVAGSTVSILYTGHLLDAAGTVFDASSKHDNVPTPLTVGGGKLIPGFEEGLRLMHVGDKAEFIIPSGLAFGPSGFSPTVPANAVLRFEVEVVDLPVFEDNLIAAYLDTHRITTAQKRPSGLYFLPVITNSTAPMPLSGQQITVSYTGHLLNAAGTIFDSGRFTFAFGRGQVIAGFEEGIGLMHKGDKAELLIPSALAYGTQGAGTSVPANSVLRFEVEIVNIQ